MTIKTSFGALDFPLNISSIEEFDNSNRVSYEIENWVSQFHSPSKLMRELIEYFSNLPPKPFEWGVKFEDCKFNIELNCLGLQPETHEIVISACRNHPTKRTSIAMDDFMEEFALYLKGNGYAKYFMEEEEIKSSIRKICGKIEWIEREKFFHSTDAYGRKSYSYGTDIDGNSFAEKNGNSYLCVVGIKTELRGSAYVDGGYNYITDSDEKSENFEFVAKRLLKISHEEIMENFLTF